LVVNGWSNEMVSAVAGPVLVAGVLQLAPLPPELEAEDVDAALVVEEVEPKKPPDVTPADDVAVEAPVPDVLDDSFSHWQTP
jgi:hypothetical protein